MQSKLQSIAQTFVREAGDNLQSYTFVFPNRRAGLFFRKYISLYAIKPMFAPRVITINDCFLELSDLQVADQLTLLLDLYDEYQRLRSDVEGLDRFIYWGKMMLDDFSEIDNHLTPHVKALFASITDIHTIDQHYSYLTENQRLALSRFWTEFIHSETSHTNGDLHVRFLHTWDLLYPLYIALQERLFKKGLAYEGMLHRQVIEHWDEIPVDRFHEQYVFLGFNALTASERELMLRLQDMGRADFYFDYDSPFLSDSKNKASLFMEENQRLFHSCYSVPRNEAWSTPNIQLISVPTTVSETHEVHRILSQVVSDQTVDLTRTAVVLPDEQLLIPLMNAFPERVGKINVTMGYPLRATSLYMPVAYPEQFMRPMPAVAEEFIHQMYKLLNEQRNEETSEGVYQLMKVLDRLEDAMRAYPQITFTVVDMQQLFKMMTLETTIPYLGEPLDGLQVMGVLETRALDFDNVIITGFNDELYPGRARGNSFIPYTLRRGFDLPTPERQDAIFAYNFYRMLSYAKQVWLITNSTTDGVHSGEVSRFLHQLRLQYHIPVQECVVTNRLVLQKNSECKEVVKDERVQQLEKLSSTALTTYLSCPKKFYYKYIEKYKEPSPDESVLVSYMTLGNVLHAIMQYIYEPFISKQVTATDIEQLLAQINDDSYWTTLPQLTDLQGDPLTERVIRTYVNNVLTYDYYSAPFYYIGSERYLHKTMVVGTKKILLHGLADRIDRKADYVRVIDYKTGSVNLEFRSMEELFGIDSAKEELDKVRNNGNAKVFQTLLYCWLLNDQYTNMIPHLYPVRCMTDLNTQTAVFYKEQQTSLIWNEQLCNGYERELMALIEEILDPNLPFYPATDSKECDCCPFVQLCKV